MSEEEILRADKELMLHALGCVSNVPKRRWGYRNYFAVDRHHYAIAGLERNVQRQWMKKICTAEFCSLEVYFVTRLGMEALQLPKAVINRVIAG